MDYSSIEEIFAAFHNLKVLIIGDSMIDTYIYGDVRRISPEAPVPIVSVTSRDVRPGGAANVALNIQQLGAKPFLCSVIGADSEGVELKELLSSIGLSTEFMISSCSRVTTVKNRIISGSNHLLRVDREDDSMILPDLEDQLLRHIFQVLPVVDLVIFEDYDKGTISAEVIRQTVAKSRELAIPVVADPKNRHFDDYLFVSMFKPNLVEFQQGIGALVDADNIEALVAHGESLLQKNKSLSLLLTLSGKGMLFMESGKFGHIPAHLRKIADVSGAGDTVISIAALCLALKLPLKFIAELANLGGGIVCEYSGVVPIDSVRLLREARSFGIFP